MQVRYLLHESQFQKQYQPYNTGQEEPEPLNPSLHPCTGGVQGPEQQVEDRDVSFPPRVLLWIPDHSPPHQEESCPIWLPETMSLPGLHYLLLPSGETPLEVLQESSGPTAEEGS